MSHVATGETPLVTRDEMPVRPEAFDRERPRDGTPTDAPPGAPFADVRPGPTDASANASTRQDEGARVTGRACP